MSNERQSGFSSHQAKNSSQGMMRVAVLEAPQQWALHEAPIPVPGPDEVLLRMEGCGVCASGLPVWEGREWFQYPLQPGALGHEGWGRVVGRGAYLSESEWPDGLRVASMGDGVFATHVCHAPEQLLPLPEELDGIPYPAEPIGCAQNILLRSDIQTRQKVIIVGMGFLGGLLLQLLLCRGARVAVVSRRPFPLQVALDLGAEVVVPLEEPWKVKQTLDAEGWGSAPRVIEAVGNQEALDVASELVEESGKLIIAGYHQDDLRQVNMQSWNWRGIDVVNAHERDLKKYRTGMLEGINSVLKGRINLPPLLTHRYPLERINAAYQDLQKRPDGFIKGWVDFV